MTLNQENRWAAAGAIGGAALIIYSPITYWLTDKISLGKGYVARNNGRTPTYAGIFLHTVVLFFVAFGLLSIPWTCE